MARKKQLHPAAPGSYARGKRMDIDTAYDLYEKAYERKLSQQGEMVSKKLTKDNFKRDFENKFTILKEARKDLMLTYNPTSKTVIRAMVDEQAGTYSLRQAIAAKTYLRVEEDKDLSLSQVFAELNSGDSSFWYNLYAERANLQNEGYSKKQINEMISALFFYGS